MRTRLLVVTAALALLFGTLAVLYFQAPATVAETEIGTTLYAGRRTVAGIEFLGEVTFETGFTFAGTEVGGLSAITYDAGNDVYYALSDDRSEIDPARFYSLAIDVADGDLQAGDVTFQSVVTLTGESAQPFPAGSLDPEGIALSGEGTLFISSEGVANQEPPIAPFVNEFALHGQQLMALPVPGKYLPTTTAGIRNNLAFESLALTPDERFLYTAVENALLQDGPAAGVGQESLSRVLQYDRQTGLPVHEFVYIVDAVPQAPIPPDGFSANGLVELLALDNNGTLLALERAFSQGVGNTVRLYEARTQGALDVYRENDLFWEEEGIPFTIDPPVDKRLLLDFAGLGLTPDNLEGMTLGPQLADGRQTLIVVSDNNFSGIQVTQFIALALELNAVPAALPDLETKDTIDDAEALAENLAGVAGDPATWVHPTDSGQSLVIATLKDGGMVVFGLDGSVLQTILPAPFGDIGYNSVDLVYGFELDGERVDLAVVSDRANDTLAIYRIDLGARQLADVTAVGMLQPIFGIDDGEHTAYGLATYTSPVSGEAYAFVTQAGGNQVAQLMLDDNGSGQVEAAVVRTLALPVPTGDPADSQAEGIVVDRERGYLYVAMEKEAGVLKFSAEPGGGDSYTVIQAIGAAYLQPGIKGLTLYYGPDGSGYLLLSSQGDSTYAVFERSGNNAYLGSFIIAGNGTIDQANGSGGAGVINMALGANYPNGLLVVQDSTNDPQSVVENRGELENNSTNFKFVPWESVANAFSTPLLIDASSYNPRAPHDLIQRFELYVPLTFRN